jgi:thiamine biosynthesis lipoprotein
MNSFLKLLLLALSCSTLGLNQNQPLQEFKIKGLAQGTTYAINYFAKDSIVTKKQVDSILNVIDSSMSLYKSYSSIQKFNQSEKGMALDYHFLAVVKRSFEIYKDSNGLFDITVAPLMQYWGFRDATPVKKQEDLAKILPCIGMDQLKLTGNFLSKQKPCLQLDVNGIAQGYSVDVLADYFKQKNIKIFLIEVGGELRIGGPKPDGSSMKIGIEGPTENQFEEPTIQHILSLKEGAITTSGNYRNYLLKGDQKISHLIDPKTGYPLATEMISVTVYAKNAITADGYDNVLMAMHLPEALNFLKAHRNLEAYFIYKMPNGKLADTASAGFKNLILQ